MNENNEASAPPGRSPWFYLCWDSIFPGLGYFRAGLPVLGVISAIAIPAALAILFLMKDPRIPSSAVAVAMAVLFIGRPVLWILLHRLTRTPQSIDNEAWRALWVGTFFPGFGHLTRKRWLGFLAFFVGAFVVVGMLSGIGGDWRGILGASMLYAWANSAALWNVGHDAGKGAFRFIIAYTILTGVFLMPLVGTYRDFSHQQNFRVVARSMNPTLNDGDRITVDTAPFTPARLDVVMFNSVQWNPQLNGALLTSRVVALPGDAVEFKPDGLWVNGIAVKHPRGGDGFAYAWAPVSGEPGRIVLPPQHYYLLGDNAELAADSRVYGPLHRDFIQGKVIRVWWPLTAMRLVN